MQFYTWLTKNYKRSDGPQGELARFLKTRKLRTASHAHDRNFAALMCGKPAEDMIRNFEVAWNEYAALKACGKV